MGRRPEDVNPGARRVALYARVSTANQDAGNQLDELRAVAARAGWEVVREYVDRGISGAKGRDARPALNRMLQDATRREFGTVACWSLDRLGRSAKHLADVCEDMRSLGVGLYFHRQAVDTTTPTGKLFFTVLSGVAEFERELIRERVVAGLDRARRKGKRLGRPPKVTPRMRRKIVAAREAGMPMRQIARELGVSAATVHGVVGGAGAGR